MGQQWQGTIAIEGQPTGDDRMIEPGALRWDDDAPISLLWDRDEGDHTAMVVGSVDRIWRDGDLVMAEGVLHDDSNDEATAAAALRVAELITPGEDGRPPAVGVSVGMDDETVEIRIDAEAIERMEEEIAAYDDGEIPEHEVADDGRVVVARWASGEELAVYTDARVRHVAVVDTSAIADARIALAAAVASNVIRFDTAMVAAVAADWAAAYRDPQFGATADADERLVRQTPERPGEPAAYGVPLTVTDDGRVFGHAALWGRCHAGFSDRCVTAPRTGDYRRFLSGEAVPGAATGPITVGTVHAKLIATMTPQQVMDHYSDTGRAVADVAVGEDEHGIWVAGRIRAGVSDEDVAALMGSPLSGDWRMIGGRWRLCGLLAVNNPGFLVERHQHDAALAAGAVITAGPCDCHPYGALAAALGDGQSGSAVMLLPSVEDAERLAQDGYEPADVLHLTVAWTGSADDLDNDAREQIMADVEVAAETIQPFTGQAFAPAVFNPDSDEPADVLLVQDTDGALASMRGAVGHHDVSEYPVWFPHVTIGYDMTPDARQGVFGLTGDIRFDRVAVGFGDDVTVYNLDGAGSTDDSDATDGDDGDMGTDDTGEADAASVIKPTGNPSFNDWSNTSNGRPHTDVAETQADVAALAARVLALEADQARAMRKELLADA